MESYFVGFEPFSTSETDCNTIDNNDARGVKSIRQVNELVGIAIDNSDFRTEGWWQSLVNS